MDFSNDVDGMTGIDWLSYDDGLFGNDKSIQGNDDLSEMDDAPLDIDDETVEVESNPKPYVGLRFDTLEKAEEFYNQYAYTVRFSIRKGSQYISAKTKLVTGRVFVCSMEGLQKIKNKPANGDKGTPKKDMTSIRTGCKARMRVKQEEDTKWVVTSFEEEHNHELTQSPSKKRFHRSHRHMSVEVRDLVRVMHDQNISSAQIMSLIASQRGGIRNVSFIRKDLSNELVSLRRKYIGIDVSSTLEHFRKLQAINPSFYYSIQIDEDGCTRSIFWVDAKSRTAYQTFGDVITFDTTYMTNKYSMPFAPFIGVNHHKQSTLFGCALLRDETADSFVWVFQTFLEAMYGKHPKAILTDQDPAMRKAIHIVFPNAVHRCCQWHIMRKAREPLGVIYGTVAGFSEEFHCCINKSITIDEFEDRWQRMICKFNLSDNAHLCLLWNIRDQWIPVYFRDTFFANMSTTQRSESMNAIFKDHVNNHLPLFKFVEAFEKVVESRYDKEDEEDFRSKFGKPNLWSFAPIESHARDVYTRTIFKDFREQLKLTSCYDLEEINKDSLYHITHISREEDLFMTNKHYKVTFKREVEEITCDCKHFQFSGILCSHALKVLTFLKFHKIPPFYVLGRWTLNANTNNKVVHVEECQVDLGDSTMLSRYNSLCRSAMKLVGLASKDKGTYIMVQEILQNSYDKVLELQPRVDPVCIEEQLPMSQSYIPTQGSQYVPLIIDGQEHIKVRDPITSQCKGTRKPQRFKPPAEMKAKKQRTCSTCNAKGHNSRTCTHGGTNDASNSYGRTN